MNLLLIGGNGSIGRRYQAILNYLGIKHSVLDEPDTDKAVYKLHTMCGVSYSRAIICTPTETHKDMCEACIDIHLPFMVEKPFTKSYEDCIKIAVAALKTGLQCRVVNNYWFLLEDYEPQLEITYDFYNTGKDGFTWDLCQLVHYCVQYNVGLTANTKSPIWRMSVDGKNIPYWKAERSYIFMLINWLTNDDKTMDLYDGAEMTKTIEEMEQDEDLDRYSITKFEQTS